MCKNEKELIALKKGDFFGETSYLIKYKRTATIKAQKNVSVLVLNAETIERTSESCQIRFQKEFIRTLINRLVNTTELLARSGFKRSDS